MVTITHFIDYWFKTYHSTVYPNIIFNICKLCLPFFSDFNGWSAFRIRSNIAKLVRIHYPDIKIQMVFRSAKRISSLLRYKDCFPSLLCSSVLYKFSCSGCNATYYGKNSMNLLIRCNEHLGIKRSGHKLFHPSGIMSKKLSVLLP